MKQDTNLVELLDTTADERLLDGDGASLPKDLGRPEPVPPSRAKSTIVGAGATMTGLTLVLGVVLIAAGAIAAIASGIGGLAVVAFVLGLVLASTHWGWVHVAEFTATGMERRRHGEIVDRRQQWLKTIKPYTRYEVSTHVADDGSICIARTRYTPVRSRPGKFRFERETESEEVHSGEEPAAKVTERAELLRRLAAADTERERERFEAADDAYQAVLLGRDDERQQLEARRAASAALSEQINANLRDPPLTE